MTKRIIAICFIYLSTAVAWAILGTTVFVRTNNSDSTLRSQVASLWGAPQEQSPAQGWYSVPDSETVTTTEDGKQVTRARAVRRNLQLPIDKSRVQAALHLDYRRKGLLWYSTYTVNFAGAYDFRNDSGQPQDVTFSLNFPTGQAIYDDVTFTVNGAPLAIGNANMEAYGSYRMSPGEVATVRVAYRSQGLESWTYNFGDKVNQVKDFELRVATDFTGFDFPENTLSPTEEHQTSSGWNLVWNYKNLISGYKIGLAMPEKLQPGPITWRISFFAPVSLLFFFFVLFVITTVRGIELHPMNYFFLACAFFSFHLLMAYLVDHIALGLAFLICSAVSVFLVISYLGVVAGMRFAALEAGLAQLVYLVLFSYAFFFEGFTGLAIATGAILTLFVVMQVTAKIRWSEQFARKPAPGYGTQP
ncbi:MAG TPA: inner membrane CreD family protein [Candidatus Acidoferrum sp.]|jgi:inner membrane protein involved in colicin E2 resistance|nr:inner membrane CreD family protein [Candidatus Acidoferrum sp.]